MPNGTKIFELSNRLYVVIAIFLGVLAIYFGFQAYLGYKTLPENNVYPETLSITGEGKASISPDIAAVDLGITTEGAKVEKIVQENTDAMNKLLADIKTLGIAEKDIKTKAYSLQPRYEYDKDRGERIFKGYTLSQTIEVKIRDFSKIGNVLETAANDGANNVSDLQFTIDDMEKARAQAREKAITQAKAKAQAIASQTGIKLKKITGIYEDTGVYPYPIYDTAGMEAGMTAKAVSSVAPTIQSGEQEVTVRITLNYRVK